MMAIEGELSVATIIAHSIRWEFNGDAVRAVVVCAAPEGADCRLGAEDWNVCQCEQWAEILHDETGRPYHVVDDEWATDEERDKAERHYMKDSGECQVCLFLNESGCIEEMCDDGWDQFVIASTPIQPVWMGDYYGWKRAAS